MILSIRLNFITFILFLSLVISSKAFAVYDKIAIDITPNNNQIQFCFDFDTKTYSENNPSLQLDKSFLIAITKTLDVLFIFNGTNGLEVSPWQQGVEPPVFLPWTKDIDSFCLPMLNKDTLLNFDLYCAVGTSFNDVIDHNRYIRFFHGAVNPKIPQPKKNWTVMVYMIGSDIEPKDSNKPKNASIDILEMINGTADSGSDKLNVVLANGGALRYGWNSMKKSLISQGQQYLLEDSPSADMLDPSTLESFVVWGVNNFPADHYALIMWDHGGGAMGFGLDPYGNTEGETISLTELKQVYTNIKQRIGKNLDAVVYDACFMASLEVVEITSIAADAMSASAENIPVHGIDYTNLIQNLALNNIDKGTQFAKLAKTSYLKQCKELSNFDSNSKEIPHRAITYSVFDLTQTADSNFKNSMKTFASSFKSAIESGAHQPYEAASSGIIRALGYPFKKQDEFRSFSDTHTPSDFENFANNTNPRIDFGGFLNNLKSKLPLLSSQIEQVQNSIQQLVVDYEGNVANIEPASANYNGRLSIDIETGRDYINALPGYFTDIENALVVYKQSKESDTSTPESREICSNGTVCADFPNWLELHSQDVLGLTVYNGLVNEDYFQVSKIESIKPKENPSSNIKIKLPSDDICFYKLCISDDNCNVTTIKYINGLLITEAVVNGVNSILTFCPKDENEWSVCSVVESSGNVWGREESLYSEDAVKTFIVKKMGGKTEIAENALLSVENPAQVVLKKDCSIKEADKKIAVSFYGASQKLEEKEELCRGENCKDAGILIIKD